MKSAIKTLLASVATFSLFALLAHFVKLGDPFTFSCGAFAAYLCILLQGE